MENGPTHNYAPCRAVASFRKVRIVFMVCAETDVHEDVCSGIASNGELE